MKRAALVAGLILALLGSSPGQSSRTGGRARGADRPRTERPAVVPRRSPEPRSSLAPARPSRPVVRPSPQRQGLRPETAPGSRPEARRREYENIFSSVQRGISAGSVEAFSGHMAPQVYVSLRGGESGYYSASQAYYLLDNYFRIRKFGTFNFTTIGESDSNPYATGSARCTAGGGREFAQIYVSLSHTGERWVITQINIY